jgi:hypothetical protein
VSHKIAVNGGTTMRRPIAAAMVLLSAVIVAAAVATAVWPFRRAEAAAGAATADVLGRPEPVGGLRLLVFLKTQPDIAAGSSRSQAVEIGSLMNQYGPRGLSAEIVDESGASRNALINTYYDWQLGAIHVAADPGRRVAARYGVDTAPVTLLLDRSGSVVDRWNSYVLPAQAGQAISGEFS